MPCNEWEEDQAEDEFPAARRQKKRTKRGAELEESDDEGFGTDEPPDDRSRRKWNGKAEFELVKRWVTGERAELEPEDIQREMFEIARDFMTQSKLKKLPSHRHNPNDFHIWKFSRRGTRTKSGEKFKVYKCPMCYRCGCDARIRITTGPEFTQIEKHGEHNPNSHDEDKSKYLKHDQIVAVSDAVTIAPNISAAVLRRNLLMVDAPGTSIGTDMLRSVRYRVMASRKKLSNSQMEGHGLDGTFGSLSRFAERLKLSHHIARHNDPNDDFHIDIFSPVVIGADIQARNDVIHLNITSPWFLMNVFRSIMTGWGSSQLNGDATHGFCRTTVDMIGLGVNSIGGHNNPLTWSIIPKGAEGSITYDLTFEEMQEAALEIFDIAVSCSECAFCKTLDEIRKHPDVIKYTKTQKFYNAMLPFTSAQCDNHLGWQKFARDVLGIDANICKNHVLGEYIEYNSNAFYFQVSTTTFSIHIVFTLTLVF
jgi:hypothetical protein